MMQWFVAVALGVVLFNLIPARPALAVGGDTATWSGVWNGDKLTVTVVARGHDIPDQTRSAEPWWRWGNTSTDAYLFYWSDDQLIDLVLDFSVEDSRPVARLYVPTLQTQREAIRVDRGLYVLPEGLSPILTLWPRNGDWLVDGLASFDLEGIEAEPSIDEVQWAWSIGGDKPGSPKWSVRKVLSGISPDADYPHYQASMRMDPTLPFEMATPVMPSWPYLSAVQKEEHYGRIQPIFFDPSLRSIVLNWAGFHIAGMYQVNSIAYPPYVNFEAPFAFYQFDPKSGRYPNLVIRSDIWPRHLEYEPSYETAVRMTWTADAGNLWRYSLTAAGNYAPGTEVTIGDDSIYAVPYAEYPVWIASKEWKAVTFVEATGGVAGSEGIYDYSVEDNPPVTEWINGLTTDPPIVASPPSIWEPVPTLEQLAGAPIATFQSPYIEFPNIHPLRLDEGFRGEYSLVYNRKPQLYFSTVDNRAHLLYAHEGLWNLGNGQILRSHNLDDGPYVNGWTRERINPRQATIDDGVTLALPGEVEESLYVLNDFLICSTANTVVLKQLADHPDVSDVPLPIDEAQWQAFIGAATPTGTTPRDPYDLMSWADALSGESVQIEGGQISDVRATENGFRFVLDLRQDYRVAGANQLDPRDLQPGRYVVTYDGTFAIQPLTPPEIFGALDEIDIAQLQPLFLRLTVSNRGLQDVLDADLEIQVKPENGPAEIIVRQPIVLPGESTIEQAIEWVAWQPGIITITPSVILPNNRRYTLTPMQVTITPDLAVQPTSVMSATAPRISIVAAGLGLLVFVAIAGTLSWQLWSVPRVQRRDDGI